MWWELQYTGDSQEEVINLLWMLGAEGVIEEPRLIKAFFQGDQESITSLHTSLTGVTEPDSVVLSPVNEENWTQQCQELLATVVLGDITVIPIQSAEDALPPKKDAVYIIPGMGFGTGHHETTSTVIQLLQHKALQAPATPQKIMDFGTGSGILAIAAMKLFPDSQVWANDIDEDALTNARENSLINGISTINFFNDEITSPKQSFDLLIANVYAEVLCQFVNTFYGCLNPKGKLILSGIMTSLVPMIRESFDSDRWVELEHVQLGNWNSFLFSKV